MAITHAKTIPHVDNTITKDVMANVIATILGEQFKRMTTGCSKYIKSKHMAHSFRI